MSLLQEVIEQYCQPEASSETPKPLSDKSAKRGSGTYGTESPGHSHISKDPGAPFDRSRVVSVDRWSKRLRDTPDELRRAAEDDWDDVSNDPAQLVAFAHSLAIVQIRESGGVPDSYTSTTECKHCGTVPIWPDCPPQVNGCPWCFNRHKGLPMPNAGEIA